MLGTTSLEKEKERQLASVTYRSFPKSGMDSERLAFSIWISITNKQKTNLTHQLNCEDVNRKDVLLEIDYK